MIKAFANSTTLQCLAEAKKKEQKTLAAICINILCQNL